MNDINIKDQLYCHILIEDTDVPQGSGLYDSLTIIENANTLVPVLGMTVSDTSRSTEKGLNIIDGTKIKVKLCKKQSDNVPYAEFSVFTHRIRGTGDSAVTQLFCILDTPKWTGHVNRGYKQGTSSDAIAQLARDSGLTPDVQPTTDSQVWLGMQQTTGSWAHDIAKHSFASDTACMAIAVTATKKMLYKDVVDLITKPPRKVLAQDGAVGTLKICDHRASSTSGVSNNAYNYGYELLTRNGKGELVKFKKAQVKVTENSVPINAKNNQAIDVRRFRFTATSEGNTHDMYYKSEHRNAKLRSLFTERLSVLLDEVSDLNVFDTVEVRLQRSATDPSLTSRSGKYLVLVKTRVLRGGVKYGERLELVRHQSKNEGLTQAMNNVTSETEPGSGPGSSGSGNGSTGGGNNDNGSVVNLFRMPKAPALPSLATFLSRLKVLGVETISQTLNLKFPQLKQIMSILRNAYPLTFEGYIRAVQALYPNLKILTDREIGALRNIYDASKMSPARVDSIASSLNVPPAQVDAMLTTKNDFQSGSTSTQTTLDIFKGDGVWDNSIPPTLTPATEEQIQRAIDLGSNSETNSFVLNFSDYLSESKLTAVAQDKGYSFDQITELTNVVGESTSYVDLSSKLNPTIFTPADIGNLWTYNEDRADTWLTESGTRDYLTDTGVAPATIKSLMAQADIPLEAIQFVCELPSVSKDSKDFAYRMRDTVLSNYFVVTPNYLGTCAELFELLKHLAYYQSQTEQL